MKLSRYNNEAISYNYEKKIDHISYIYEGVYLLTEKLNSANFLPAHVLPGPWLSPTNKTVLIFTASPWIPC